MEAAVLNQANEPLSIEELDLPALGPTHVLVRLAASGVCHSDWHVIKGDWPDVAVPTVLGHEGSGVVELVGDAVVGIQPGDHVILNWQPSCGRCEMCQRGYPNLCHRGPDLTTNPVRPATGERINKFIGLGTFGTHTLVPHESVIVIDPDMPFEQASLIGCAVMTGVGAVINTARVKPGRSVAVFGCGGVGLNCIQGALLAGAEPIMAVDIYDHKLEMARQFGATHLVNARQEDPVQRIVEITDGHGAHYAFEAVGLSGETYRQSIECTRRRGVTVFVGLTAYGVPIELESMMLYYEKTVMGTRYGTARPHIDFPRLIRLYKAGKLKLDELVSRIYPLEEVNEAFRAMAGGEVARGVLRLED